MNLLDKPKSVRADNSTTSNSTGEEAAGHSDGVVAIITVDSSLGEYVGSRITNPDGVSTFVSVDSGAGDARVSGYEVVTSTTTDERRT